jgi:hypothetical protein
VLWPCSLHMSLTYELATFRTLVLPDYRLLGG